MPTIPNNTMENNLIPQAEKIAAIVAITQVIKYYGVPSKFLPIFAIIIGVILEYSENPNSRGVLDGIILGAVTTGSYGVVKNAATYTIDTMGQKDTTISPEKITQPDPLTIIKDLNQLEHDDYRGV